jgi:hypothetical protein
MVRRLQWPKHQIIESASAVFFYYVWLELL